MQIAQAKQEQHAADVAHVQNQISKEISDDYRKKSNLLASRALVPERVLDNAETSSGSLSGVSVAASRIAQASTNFVFASANHEIQVTCDQLIKDASQTTLMLVEVQNWYEKMSKIYE